LLFVEDNGQGMNKAATDGHGLLNIKSRLDMINGSVDYAPSPESGTSVTIKIPIV
jgi:signal transduction histidine kinase